MASNDEASIRVTADTASFQQGMREAARSVDKAGGKMESSLKSSLKEGFEAGKDAAKDLAGSVKDVVTNVATLGGAVSVGALAHSAAMGQKANIALANALSNVQGRFVEVAEAQGIVERAAMGAGVAFEDARESALQLAGVSDKADMEDMLKRAHLQAQRLGLEGHRISRIYTRLVADGVASTAAEAEAMTEQIGRTAQKAFGIDLDEAFDPNDVAEFITFMKRGNMQLDESLNLLELMGGFSKDFGKGIELGEELGEQLRDAKELEAIRKASGLTSDELNATKDAAENLFTIMQNPKALKEMSGALAVQARAGLGALLGEGFLDRAIAGKKIEEDEMQAAMDRVTKVFTRQATEQFDVVENEKRNAEILQSQAARFQEAMSNLEKAFQSEKVAGAIDKVAEKLPAMAEGIAGMVEVVAEHPMAAIMTAVGAKLAMAMGSTVIQSAASSAIEKAMASAAVSAAASGGYTNAAAKAFAQSIPKISGAFAALAIGYGIGSEIDKQLGISKSTGDMGALDQQVLRSFDGKDQSLVQGALQSGNAKRIEMARNIMLDRAAQLEQGPSGMGKVASALGLSDVSSEFEKKAKKAAEAAEALGRALEKTKRSSDDASKGLGRVATSSGGAASSGAPRGPLNVPQQDGAAPVAG